MKLSMPPTQGDASLGIAAEKGTHVHRKSQIRADTSGSPCPDNPAVDSGLATEKSSSTFKEVNGSGHGDASPAESVDDSLGVSSTGRKQSGMKEMQDETSAS